MCWACCPHRWADNIAVSSEGIRSLAGIAAAWCMCWSLVGSVAVLMVHLGAGLCELDLGGTLCLVGIAAAALGFVLDACLTLRKRRQTEAVESYITVAGAASASSLSFSCWCSAHNGRNTLMVASSASSAFHSTASSSASCSSSPCSQPFCYPFASAADSSALGSSAL